jgi:hypothetical protein
MQIRSVEFQFALKSTTLAREIAAYGCLLVGSEMGMQAFPLRSPLSL